jgi:ribulose-phosphate 3-epimerase
MLEVIPGILEKDWASIEEKIKQVKTFAKTIHIDIIDGEFAQNTTFLDPTPFKKYSSEAFFETQMMVNDPLKYVEKYAAAGFKRFIGQIENMPSQKEFIDSARKHGEAGLAIDLQTSLESVQVDFNYPDCFLLMSVKAGFSGQAFSPEAFEKIRTLRKKTKKPIEIDGGVNEATITKLKDLGVDRCVVTSGLSSADDITKEYQKLQSLAS